MFDYNIIDNPIQIGQTPAIEILLNKAYLISCKKGTRSIRKLKRMIKEHPSLPVLWTYLADCYMLSDKFKHAYQVKEEQVEQFPDYLLGKTELAEDYLELEEYEKVLTLLQKKGQFNLSELYPNRKAFHKSEVIAYHGVVCKYFMLIDDLESAGVHLSYLQEVDDYDDTVHELTDMFSDLEWGNLGLSYDKDIQTDVPPEFTHPEIWQLYENDSSIDDKIVEQILALPRASLIEDLEKVLEDCVKRYEYFEESGLEEGWKSKRGSFPIHALFLLAELKSEDSTELILSVIRQGSEVEELWFDDLSEFVFEEALFHVAQYELDKLRDFLLGRHIHYYRRNFASSVVSKIVIAYPERRAEGIQWFKEVFTYLIENHYDEQVMDVYMNSYFIRHAMDIQAIELLPLIKKIFELDIVDPFACGEFDYIQRSILEDKEVEKPCSTIYERYAYWKQQMEDNTMVVSFDSAPINWEEEEKEDENYLNSISETRKEVFRLSKKVGRNAPCPCGSGKKYKRCCGKK